jgi:hypothetical protein
LICILVSSHSLAAATITPDRDDIKKQSTKTNEQTTRLDGARCCGVHSLGVRMTVIVRMTKEGNGLKCIIFSIKVGNVYSQSHLGLEIQKSTEQKVCPYSRHIDLKTLMSQD